MDDNNSERSSARYTELQSLILPNGIAVGDIDGAGVGDSVGYKSSTNLQSVPAKQTFPAGQSESLPEGHQ